MNNQKAIQGKDIVVVGQQPWDTEIGSNCRDVALEFSKHNRVLYVNYPLDRGTLWKHGKDPKVQKRLRVIRKEDSGLVSIGPNMWNLFPDELIESINWINQPWLFDRLNLMNGKRYARSIMAAIQQLGFKDIILFNDNDILRSYYLKELLQPAISIYYYRDFILGVDYWRKHGVRLEPGIISKSDICCTNSTYFRDHFCLPYNPNSYYVGQGCDLHLFSDITELSKPTDMEKISGPVIGYVGALQSLRLDIEVLVYMAQQRPAWQIVLVGPEDEQFRRSRLHQLPNVHFLGAKHPDELPQYIKYFDVCLNPQLINNVTIGNYPRKIDEYLALGKPIVATRTQLMEDVFAEYTYLGIGGEEYVTLTELALASDNTELRSARKAFAATHSWESHVDEIYAHIKTFLTNNRS
jgi:glycosyltransferase involved in cell wall biosynthesis